MSRAAVPLGTHEHSWSEVRSQGDALLGWHCWCGEQETVGGHAAVEAAARRRDERERQMAEEVKIECRGCGLTVAVPRRYGERGYCCGPCMRRRARYGGCAACANGGQAPVCSETLRDGRPCTRGASQIDHGRPLCGFHAARA